MKNQGSILANTIHLFANLIYIYWYIFVEILHVRHCSGYWAYSYEWTKVLPSWSLYSRKSINIDGERSYSVLGYETHKGLWVQSDPGWVPLSICLKLFSCGGHVQLRGWKLLASPFPKRTWWLTDATLSSQLPLDLSAGATADFCSTLNGCWWSRHVTTARPAP